MNIFSILIDKMSGNSVTDEQLSLIRKYVDTITESTLSSDSESRDRLTILRYTDETFSVIKTILYYPNGETVENRSIVLRDGSQVYDGNNAIRVDYWFNHLTRVYNDAAIRSKHVLKYKRK